MTKRCRKLSYVIERCRKYILLRRQHHRCAGLRCDKSFVKRNLLYTSVKFNLFADIPSKRPNLKSHHIKIVVHFVPGKINICLVCFLTEDEFLASASRTRIATCTLRPCKERRPTHSELAFGPILEHPDILTLDKVGRMFSDRSQTNANGTYRVMHHSLSNLIIRDYLTYFTFIRPTERWTLMKIGDKVTYQSIT